MRKIFKLAGASVAATAAMAALLVGPAAAGQGVDLGSTAQLVAKGAAILVPVQATCGDPTFPSTSVVTVTVNERAANRIVFGNGSASVTCDGTAHTVEVLVKAQEAPFKPGTALATASMFFCGSGTCAPDTAEIRIRN